MYIIRSTKEILEDILKIIYLQMIHEVAAQGWKLF